MELRNFSIILEIRENDRLGFFQTFKVQSSDVDRAIKIVLTQEKLKKYKDIKIEEIREEGIEANDNEKLQRDKIVEETGRAFFNLNE